MLFLRNFKELKINLDFFEYYYKFIKCYVIIIKSLIQLKIEGFKEIFNIKKLRRNYAKKK